jgi:hypothetical protein
VCCLEATVPLINYGSVKHNRGSNVMYYLKMKNIIFEIKKHGMFRPLSEVIIRHYKDETDKKLMQTYGSSAKRDPVR